ncbi:MAG: hypothetical protein ACE5WD_04465 [Candidatus Aminicenantia bacterium]
MNSLIEKTARYLQAARWPWKQALEKTLAVREKEYEKVEVSVIFHSLNLRSSFECILELFRKVKARKETGKTIICLEERIRWCTQAEAELREGKPQKAINILEELEFKFSDYSTDERILKVLQELKGLKKRLKQFSQSLRDTSRKQHKHIRYRVS